MNLQFSFYNKTVFITGGTRGIGRAIAEAFLQAGAKVYASYVSNEQAAQKFADTYALKSDEGKLQLLRCDVADYDAVESFFNSLENDGVKLDVLVNNSGIRSDAVLGMMKKEEWNKVIDVNLNGLYHCSKFAVQNMMKQRFGRIINITSPAGKYGFAGQTNYSATKGAMVSFSAALAKEVASRGITVNSVSPGYIDTDFIAELPEETKKAYKKSVPVRKFGTGNDVASAVLFLASSEASYITGSVLEVTGGL